MPIPGGFFSGKVFFPKDGVAGPDDRRMEMERGKPESRRRLETQLLHFDGTIWHGYSYAWNDEQTDATLVPAAGMDRVLTVIDAKAPGGKRRQTWHFPSRAECMTCHNPWAGYALAFNGLQLNKTHDYGGVKTDQLQALRQAGLVSLFHYDEGSEKATPMTAWPPVRLANPYDVHADLTERARSYLQVNCAHCHQFGAGGTAQSSTYAIRPSSTEPRHWRFHPFRGLSISNRRISSRRAILTPRPCTIGWPNSDRDACRISGRPASTRRACA